MATRQHISKLNQLFLWVGEVLGIETIDAVLRSPPRRSAFGAAVSAAIEASGNDPLKVPDIQIEGAQEIWPFEADAIASAYYEGDAS
jgi:hypothetical protein